MRVTGLSNVETRMFIASTQYVSATDRHTTTASIHCTQLLYGAMYFKNLKC